MSLVDLGFAGFGGGVVGLGVMLDERDVGVMDAGSEEDGSRKKVVFEKARRRVDDPTG